MSVTCQAEKALCPAPTRLLSKTKKEIIIAVCSVAIRASWGHFCTHIALMVPIEDQPCPKYLLFFFLAWWCLAGTGDGKADKQKISHQICKWDWDRNDFAEGQSLHHTHYPWFAPGSSSEQEKLAFPSRRKERRNKGPSQVHLPTQCFIHMGIGHKI